MSDDDSHPSRRNFVICDYQITKIFSFGARLYQYAFCKEPLSFWARKADFAISVFEKVGFYNVLPRYQLSTTGPESKSWEVFCECWHLCIFEFVCDLLQPLQEVSQAIFLCLFVIFISAFLDYRSDFPDVLFVTSFSRTAAR